MAWHDAVVAGFKEFLKQFGVSSSADRERQQAGLDDLFSRMRKQNGGAYSEDFELLKKLSVAGDYEAYRKTKVDFIRRVFSPHVDKYWIHGCGKYVHISKELLDDDAKLTARFDTSDDTGMLRYKCVEYSCIYQPKMVAIGGEEFLNGIVKKCGACLELIPSAAKKCKHCHSDT